MQDIFADLQWRGLVYQTTDDQNISTWLNEKPRVVYAGFDPTADSLHVGSLLPLMMLRRFQKAGHRPIALAGGATGMIGDPSGKSAERNLLSAEQLEANIAGIENQMRHFLDFDCGEQSAILVNNFEWMNQFSYIDFLRDIGKHFPVNVMMAKDSVKSRLEGESGLSYTEFSYMLLQAYDFVHLSQKLGCELQVGGSDQWGNITAGVELARRMHSSRVLGLTTPLLTKSDGTKMGKTETGTVWLDGNRTSPYQLFQYWINLPDSDTGKCLRFLTELSYDEISQLDHSRSEEPHLRASQKALAEHMTKLVHGQEGLARAKAATEIFFGAEIENASDDELAQIFSDVPNVVLPRDELTDQGLGFVDALVKSGLVKSKGEARRAINEGGGYINNRRCESVDKILTADDLASESSIVLRRGKKKYAILRFNS